MDPVGHRLKNLAIKKQDDMLNLKLITLSNPLNGKNHGIPEVKEGAGLLTV